MIKTMRMAALGPLLLLPMLAQAAGVSLEQVVGSALQNNPALLATHAQVGVSSAQARMATAPLRPQVGLAVSQMRQMTNLKAQGFPSFPTGGGFSIDSEPEFDTFDARVEVSQALFNRSASLAQDSAEMGVVLSKARVEQAREQIAAQAALAYLQALRADAQVRAAKADLQLAKQLLQQAEDRHHAGLVSGVDVARAKTALANDQFVLARANTGRNDAYLALHRVAVLPYDEALTLTQHLSYQKPALPPLPKALIKARAQRPEVQVANTTVKQLQLALASAQSKRYPTVQAFANLGDSANLPGENDVATYRLGARLSLPLYSGGLISAETDQAAARILAAKYQRKDALAQIETDVRSAMARVASTAQQVEAARSARDLAQIELQLSRDRFAHGVTDNVEVVEAQTRLARARAAHVDALAAYQISRLNFANALGNASHFHLFTATANPGPSAVTEQAQ